MTKEEKLIVSAYTGVLMTDFNDFHKFAEKKLDRPVFTHEFALKTTADELKLSVKKDFLRLCAE